MFWILSLLRGFLRQSLRGQHGICCSRDAAGCAVSSPEMIGKTWIGPDCKLNMSFLDGPHRQSCEEAAAKTEIETET